ncbi:hypothetical protein OsI_25649 [Oryza sativa Indica Group]|uniref:DUF834 domain-containing protein n=1 Tax=Oryza sativa subsp. indica TaxID=39946 RepID=B8B570_ORYSI|nr:hypothetical protein OsI_25649 [Oryza sativa Indica Group]
MTPTALTAQRGNPPTRREGCRRMRMKATSPLLTSEDELPAVSRRNGGEAGEEEVAAKRMVAMLGSEEVPTVGEGRPELHSGDGTRRRQRGSQGERRGRAAVWGERGGRYSFL